jgi:glycosyltransferase involved in cell wall biosynthesis
MRHLIVSREFPPAAYPPGGIGTYVANIAQLLAERGETVHVIGERWRGAPAPRQELLNGRLIIHRVGESDIPGIPGEDERLARELAGLKASAFPMQWFAWAVAHVAERLVEEQGIEVVEAQEWEAPLSQFMLRLALGLGPARKPPCIVHLHSATRFIQQFNGMPPTPQTVLMNRLEAYCIRAADALLCPSRRYADEAAAAFGLERSCIETIPYPASPVPFAERSAEVWRFGPIAFVGRLEPRKGIVEWLEAASRVAREQKHLSFDFFGADVFGEPSLKAGLGADVAAQFRFHGLLPREDLWRRLAAAQACVVPSRWENFPNVCIEAMASGLPVIATPFGGMAEMIKDGETGWIARDAGVSCLADSLSEALHRCIATPPDRKASLGAAAARSIQTFCDTGQVVERHLAFRAAVLARGAYRSKTLPRSEPFGPTPLRKAAHDAGDLAIVLRSPNRREAQVFLDGLGSQSRPPSLVLAVCAEPGTSARGRHALGFDVAWSFEPGLAGTAAWNHGVAELAAAGRRGLVVPLDHGDRLDPHCLSKLAAAFSARPSCALIAVWVDIGSHGIEAPPPPNLTHAPLSCDVTAVAGLRMESIADPPPFRPGLPRRFELWDLANRLLLEGWEVAVLPEALAERHDPQVQPTWASASVNRALHAEILDRFRAPEAKLAINLIQEYLQLPLGFLQVPMGFEGLPQETFDGLPQETFEGLPQETFRQRTLRRVKAGLRDPGRAKEWLAARILRRWRKAARSA